MCFHLFLEITWEKINNLVGGVIARSFCLHGVTLEGGGTAVIVGHFCLFVS